MNLMRSLALSALVLGVVACGDDSSEQPTPQIIPYDGDYATTDGDITDNGCLLPFVSVSVSLTTSVEGEDVLLNFPEGTLPGGASVAPETVPLEDGKFQILWTGIAPFSTSDEDFNTIDCPVEVRVSLDATVVDESTWDVSGVFTFEDGPSLDPLCEAEVQEAIAGWTQADGCESVFTAQMLRDQL